MSKYLICIFLTIIFITGCSFSNHLEKTLVKIKSLNFFSQKSKNISLNFNCALEKIILNLLSLNDVSVDNKILFFVDILKNKSHSTIDTKKLTNLIKNEISKHTNHVYFFDNKTINENKKKLGILNIKDSINTSTAILLSRNNNVKYYLYSCLDEEKNFFLLKIQLTLVKTGEIVFSQIERFYE
ncbi:hypothetical protein [Buchnera aphidicola]|uniref:hypothetical protein n=1 Tax=Buchnera aphidicola TaxID=9 RepID=UPI0034643447